MDWEKYYNEAIGYFNTAIGAKEKKKLGNMVIYNLVSISIENLITSLLVRDGMLPQHSGIGSMLRELKKNYEVPKSFYEDARLLNRYMNFCSLEIMPKLEPTDEDIEKMCSFMNELKDWIEIQLSTISKIG